MNIADHFLKLYKVGQCSNHMHLPYLREPKTVILDLIYEEKEPSFYNDPIYVVSQSRTRLKMRCKYRETKISADAISYILYGRKR
jgi:hypothetical protein